MFKQHIRDIVDRDILLKHTYCYYSLTCRLRPS